MKGGTGSHGCTNISNILSLQQALISCTGKFSRGRTSIVTRRRSYKERPWNPKFHKDPNTTKLDKDSWVFACFSI